MTQKKRDRCRRGTIKVLLAQTTAAGYNPFIKRAYIRTVQKLHLEKDWFH
jgi:hypothetical protein